MRKKERFSFLSFPISDPRKLPSCQQREKYSISVVFSEREGSHFLGANHDTRTAPHAELRRHLRYATILSA